MKMNVILKSIVLFSLMILITSSCSFMKTKSDYKNDIQHSKQIGNNYINTGELDKAKKVFLGIYVSNPNDAETAYKLGVINSRQGYLEKAESYFLKTISLNSNYSKAYYNLGSIYSTKNCTLYNLGHAADNFKRYIFLEPLSDNRNRIEQWLTRNGQLKTKREIVHKKKYSPYKKGNY